MPSYHLEELTISSSDLSTSLLWILGNSQHTLRRLHLAATIGLTSDLLLHIFLLLGNSLTDLSLSIDRDDFATPPSDALPGSILAPLVCLETLSVTTDSLFKDDLLEHLGSVEKLQEVMLCFPAFRYAPIQAFLQREPVALRELTLDTWFVPLAFLETSQSIYKRLLAGTAGRSGPIISGSCWRASARAGLSQSF